MIPNRLKLGRASFPKNRHGARASSPFFSVSYGPSKDGGCAIVVSKAVAKKAVARNLLKRRALTLMRPWCSLDRYIVLYARTGAAELSYKKLQEELSSLLSRALS